MPESLHASTQECARSHSIMLKHVINSYLSQDEHSSDDARIVCADGLVGKIERQPAPHDRAQEGQRTLTGQVHTGFIGFKG